MHPFRLKTSFGAFKKIRRAPLSPINANERVLSVFCKLLLRALVSYRSVQCSSSFRLYRTLVCFNSERLFAVIIQTNFVPHAVHYTVCFDCYLSDSRFSRQSANYLFSVLLLARSAFHFSGYINHILDLGNTKYLTESVLRLLLCL